MPSKAAGNTEETGCMYLAHSLWVSGNLRILQHAMTALIARLDVEGEVAIIADGCAASTETSCECVRRDEWKTARLNDEIAIGFAGQVDYGNQILCRLFNRRDLQAERGKVRVVRVFEDEHLEFPLANWDSTKEQISRLLLQLQRAIADRAPLNPTIAPMELSFMMVGLDHARPSICVWHHDCNWKPMEVRPKVPGEIGATVIFGPGGKSLSATGALETSGQPLEIRATQAIAHTAAANPGRVNTYTTIRRSSRGFKLEIYDDKSS